MAAAVSGIAAIAYAYYILENSRVEPERTAIGFLAATLPQSTLLALTASDNDEPLGGPSMLGAILALAAGAAAFYVASEAASAAALDSFWAFLGALLVPLSLAFVLLLVSASPEESFGRALRGTWVVWVAAAVALAGFAIGAFRADRFPGESAFWLLIGALVTPALLATLMLAVAAKLSRAAGRIAVGVLLAATAAYAYRAADRSNADIGDWWIFLSNLVFPFGIGALALLALETPGARSTYRREREPSGPTSSS